MSASDRTPRETAFSDTELDYLTSGRRLGRLATVGSDGTPHVVPVGWSYNPEPDTIVSWGLAGGEG